ncbi:unnamed protein product [Polarella glacialis]|uniref:Uncharacterized protein n=2 Tax=Polarella glacialis TaxID=89957 RepID=A0A813GR02_POLGL|nr:unnamed protein product [Polarella glacialis]
MRALRELSKHCGQAVGGRPEPLGAMDDPRRDKLRIQQSMMMGSGDPPGGKSGGGRDKVREQLRDEGRVQVVEAESLVNEEQERRKRKKNHKNEAKSKGGGGNLGGAPQDLLDLCEEDDAVQQKGSPEDLFKKPALDLKKPPLSAVQEVRVALGVAPPTNGGLGGFGGLGGLGGLAGGGLPSIGGGLGGLGGFGRLPTPPGDGLATNGRAKVRAGIRLEPLRG